MLPPPCHGGMSSSSAFLPYTTPIAAGAEQLVAGQDVEVRIERLHVDRKCDTACAPSTSTRAPRRCAIWIISRTGSIVPSALETWVNGDEPRARAEQLFDNRRASLRRDRSPGPRA